jgi:hypothetical protein
VRDLVEVSVAGEQDEVVLQDQRGDPQIVGRYRSAGPAQFGEKLRVEMGRGLVGERYLHPR